MTSVMQCCPTDVLLCVSPLLPRLEDPVLLRVGLTSHKRPKLHVTQKVPKPTGIEDISDEVLAVVLDQDFSCRDYCSLSQVSSRYRQLAVGPENVVTRTFLTTALKGWHRLQSSDTCWEAAYSQQYGITGVTRDAATLATSWKELFRSKTVTDKKVEPRISPCSYELTAVLQRIAGEQAAATQPGGVMFLLDGSGSVSQDDFDAMTDLVSKAVPVILEKAPTSKVGVLQFSNDVHIHLPLTHLTMDTSAVITTDMGRMHGGTDVALAIQTASEHMQTALPATGLKTLVIMSDGRIDKYQGQVAVVAAQAMQTAQAEASIYAFGVGCAVDRAELDSIVSATGCTDADCRYMALAVQPENLWQ